MTPAELAELRRLVRLELARRERTASDCQGKQRFPNAQLAMLAAPNTHFVMLSQGILYRGAGLQVVWPQLVSLAVIGSILFLLSLARFRKTLASMA